MHHELTTGHIDHKPNGVFLHAPAAPKWPGYKGTSQFAGNSPSGRVTVYVDPSLGDPALQNATDLVMDADRVVNRNDAIFETTGGPVSVIVFALGGATDGTGGADHMGCDYTTGAAIEVCAAFGNSARVSALFEAELSECSMGGNLCGSNTGEALSRWCAAVIGNNALSDFATAPTWVQDGMQDWVNQTEPTDQNPDSTGCGMAFISWLISKGFALSTIAPAMVALGDAGTFAQLYANLTSQPASSAWPTFQAAVNALPGGVANDDPFGAASRPSQLGHLTPWTAAQTGSLITVILTDLAAGKSADQIAATVRSALTKPGSQTGGKVSSVTCTIGSRRLLPPRIARYGSRI